MSGDADPAAELITIPVALPGRAYDIVVGAGAIDGVARLLSGRSRVVVVSQAAIAAHVPTLLDALAGAGIDAELMLIGDGEADKTLDTVADLVGRFTRSGLLRNDAVVALGGGVVGDTAGFAAAVYHRGVAVVQVPTTLLAMVDSSIGGKTGVNLPEGKNLVGAFHQPIGVFADPAVLATLPAREFDAGLGEVVKYAFLGDTELRATLSSAPDTVVDRDPATLARVVARCAAFKARVVVEDEHETSGVRATLNLGHTLAHALETAGGYDLLHGEAVSIGLVFAARLAAALERISTEAADEQVALISALGLPTAVPRAGRVSGAELIALMRRDKKSDGGLTFVLDGPRGVERVDDPPAHAVERAFAAVGIRA
ncbi:MAG: 3-dehydroquinate synthase [Actinomycetia bacterium]|nr:3-dehydroquinate synthase [Actinomycetes bacterium]